MNNICKSCDSETKPDEWAIYEEKICIDCKEDNNDDFRDADIMINET